MQSDIKTKSDRYSKILRKLGNEEMHKKCYFEALRYYNMSLCYAKSEENLAFGYANRSAVYLELKLYEISANNIEAARVNKYPITKMHKLISRNGECYLNIPKDRVLSKTSLFFQLSYPANPKIPQIVDCLEVREDQKFGRGIFATRDLNPGNILAVEDSIIIRISEDDRYVRCSQCSSCNFMSLVPCPESASFMFCSADCYDSFATYFTNFPNESFEMTQVGGLKFLKEFIADHEILAQDKTIFDFDFSDKKDPDYQKNKMICLMSIANKLPTPKDYENGSEEDGSDPLPPEFYDARAKILSTCYENNIVEYGVKGDRHLVNASGMVFAFLPLINHACYSNVDNVIINNRSILYVTKPIMAGEQLFYSHIPGEKIMKNLLVPSDIRRQCIMNRLNIHCECYYCENKIHFRMLDPAYDNEVVEAVVNSYRMERATVKTTQEEMMDQLKTNWALISKHYSNPRSLDVELLEHLNRSIIRDLAQTLTYPCVRLRSPQ